jgi:hypothetical protein
MPGQCGYRVEFEVGPDMSAGHTWLMTDSTATESLEEKMVARAIAFPRYGCAMFKLCSTQNVPAVPTDNKISRKRCPHGGLMTLLEILTSL